jgi:hypothetical protein
VAQSGNDKCQVDSTFQAHASHESERHVEAIRHMSIHVTSTGLHHIETFYLEVFTEQEETPPS